jgi:DNA modification methylase
VKPDESWNGRLHAELYREAALEHDPSTDPVEHSREFRRLLKARFGGQLPTSIWPYDASKNLFDPDSEGRNVLGVGETAGREKDQYGAQKEAGGRLSVFETALAHNCLQLWSNPGDVVLDPFAGRGVRLHAALSLGRDYRGFDVSPQALTACHRVAAGFERGGERATLYHQSSLFLDQYVQPESVDFVFTCPPYWDSEFYGDNGTGLEACPDYGAFVEELAAVFVLAANALKYDRYLCVVLRGFFLHGHFHNTPAHLEHVLVRHGLVVHDRVVKKMSFLRERFHQDVAKLRRTAQVHEEVLVFRKVPKVRQGRRAEREATHEKNTLRPANEQRLAARRREVLERWLGDFDVAPPLPYTPKARE